MKDYIALTPDDQVVVRKQQADIIFQEIRQHYLQGENVPAPSWLTELEVVQYDRIAGECRAGGLSGHFFIIAVYSAPILNAALIRESTARAERKVYLEPGEEVAPVVEGLPVDETVVQVEV